MDDLSFATKISCANRPYIVMGSSADKVAKDSIMNKEMPAGALPLVVKGLNLSKLLRRSGLRRYRVPPLGAWELTYSK